MDRLKIVIILLFVTGFVVVLFTNNSANKTAHAFSSGPPPAHTLAPGEFSCDECHADTNTATGQFFINAPQNYVPGQTYQITVQHTTNDATRIRWGFQLTALDDNDQKAGSLQTQDAFTQILDNAGPGSSRQYIEHTSSGTYPGQQNGASWTFNWTAPSTDIGPVTFYAAGNQANGDGNTSGDNIYTTFVAAQATTATPDFNITVTPSTRIVAPGNPATYTVTVTPSGGFTGQVTLSAAGLPAGANATFNPASVNITDSTAKTSTLTVTTNAGTPLGNYPLTISGTGGSLLRSAQATLIVASATSADVSISMTDSPNPATVGMALTYRIVVTNNGPATATNVTVADTLPSGLAFGSATPSQGTCNNASPVNCNLGSLAAGSSAIITIVVTPQSTGQITNTATASASETDSNNSNNSATSTTLVEAQGTGPVMLEPNLSVKTLVTGLDMPTSLAFIGANDLLVLEKGTGKVKRITGGVVQGTVLDLAVNNASERGLLGIALHPNFPATSFVYLFWTESSMGVDSSNTAEVPLLGNRVDRYTWNGTTLVFDRNLIRLRSYQEDPGQPLRGNHNGGVIRFGPDGKLYIIIGDNGRRGFLQNITSGGTVPDDQFGGPEPDDAHLTGVILRLNDDGTTPSDNPFFNANTGLSGEAAQNVKKIFAYGVRNSFGMAFDPVGGYLWTQENGDDSFDEINRVEAGFNGGWTQTMGPVSRVAQFKEIETTYGNGTIQQIRWPPSNIADTPEQALARLYAIPGSHYTDPEFSWKYAVAPSPIGFINGTKLGAQFEGDLFVGASRTTLVGGYLFRFKLSADRKKISTDDARLADLVADNGDKFDITESESILVGRDFGITTDIQTGPSGNLFVVSLDKGAIYEIYPKPPTLFVANLTGAQEVPANSSTGYGTATVLLSPDETSAKVSLTFAGLTSAQTAAHIHGPAPAGTNAPVLYGLPDGVFTDYQINLTPTVVQNLKAGLLYINVHSTNFPNGEIRGQFNLSQALSVIQFDASSYSVSEGTANKTITVTRLGDTTSAASVDYATVSGTASDRSDFTTALGTLNFAPGETSKTFTILLTDDALVEDNETATLTLTNATGTSITGSPATAQLTITDNDTSPSSANPIDDARFFVRQHYLDFLNREPDTPGWDFWTDNITKCNDPARRPAGQTVEQCIDKQRTTTSGAFFLSPEFQYTGYYVLRVYKGSLGRFPTYLEFLRDTQQVAAGILVNNQLSGPIIEQNKKTFAEEFVERAEFKAIYDSLSHQQYVDKLFETTAVAVTDAEKSALVSGLNNQTETRATVLQKVVDGILVISEGNQQYTTTYGKAFYDKEFNPAFVQMEYFGYLRRDPDAPGFAHWLGKLNFYGNYIDAEMVRAFLVSPEYRQRFGQQ